MKKFYFLILFLLLSFAGFSQEDQQADLAETIETKEQIVSSKEQNIVGFRVFPNPVTTGVLNISTFKNDNKRVQIFDVLGKRVLNRVINTTHLSIGSLKAGVYILKVTEDGKTVTRKLVVK